jgi:hypothetical protein
MRLRAVRGAARRKMIVTAPLPRKGGSGSIHRVKTLLGGQSCALEYDNIFILEAS